MEDFIAYSVGLCNLSACVRKDMTREEVKAAANRNQPTGISSKWKIAAKFKGGEPSPCPCNDHPKERLHYLLTC